MARVRKRGNRYYVYYRDPDTHKEVSAWVSFERKIDAEKVRLEIEHRLAMDRWIDPARETPSFTLTEWWQEIESTWLRRSESTRSRDFSYFRSLIEPHLGDNLLTTIDSLTLDQWIAELDDAGYSPATITKAVQLAARALREASDRGMIPRNPANGIRRKLPAIDTPDHKVISQREAHQIADATDDRSRAFVLFAFYTGTRWGETAALRRTNINLRTGTALIDATLNRNLTLGPPKTGRSRRTIHLPEPLIESLRDHLNRYYQIGHEPDLVFTSHEHRPIRYTNWRRRIWLPATKAVGLGGLRFHDLRHSHATILIDAGIDPVRVSRRLGHARTSITLDRYSHLLDRDEEAILRVLDGQEADLTRTNQMSVAFASP